MIKPQTTEGIPEWLREEREYAKARIEKLEKALRKVKNSCGLIWDSIPGEDFRVHALLAIIEQALRNDE